MEFKIINKEQFFKYYDRLDLDEGYCSSCVFFSRIENDIDAKCDEHTIKQETSFDDVLKQYS